LDSSCGDLAFRSIVATFAAAEHASVGHGVMRLAIRDPALIPLQHDVGNWTVWNDRDCACVARAAE
jgi:hypothetical protein